MPQNSTLKISMQYVKYATEMQPFVDESGLIGMAFAVQFDRENAWLWRPARQGETSQSPYCVKFDPSLVLPGKFVRQVVNIGGSVVIATWLPNTDQKAAMLMRGVRFYDLRAAQYTTAPLKRGGIYRISFPMYNASFYPADGSKLEVKVRLGRRLITSDTASGTETIGDEEEMGTTTVELGGWALSSSIDDGDPNKAMAEFDWAVPDTAGDGKYDLVVTVEPDNEYNEVHEAWSSETPGGNNEGRYPFAIEGDQETEAATASVRMAAEEDTTLLDVRKLEKLFDTKFIVKATSADMSLAGFTAYALEQTEPFQAIKVVTYKGTETLSDVNIRIVQDMVDTEHNNAPYFRVLESHYIPALFPGKTDVFEFTADPEKIAESERLVANGKIKTLLRAANATPITRDEAGGSSAGGGSSDGCDAGLGASALAVIALAAVMVSRAKKQ